MEYNPEGHIVDITEQKEEQEHAQTSVQTGIPVPHSRYYHYLKKMMLWRYTRRAIAVFVALIMIWGWYARPDPGDEFWLGPIVTAGALLTPFAFLGLGQKETSKYYVASLGIFYSLFAVYPPLVEFVGNIIQTLCYYLP